jgi:hypothetical protein
MRKQCDLDNAGEFQSGVWPAGTDWVSSTSIHRFTLLIRSGKKTALSEHHISVRIRVNLVTSVRSGGFLYSQVTGDGYYESIKDSKHGLTSFKSIFNI